MTTAPTDSPLAMDVPACGQSPGSGTLWIVAIVMLRREANGSISIAQSVAWRYGLTEDESRGQAVKVAMDSHPGFAIEMVSIASETRLSPNKD